MIYHVMDMMIFNEAVLLGRDDTLTTWQILFFEFFALFLLQEFELNIAEWFRVTISLDTKLPLLFYIYIGSFQRRESLVNPEVRYHHLLKFIHTRDLNSTASYDVTNTVCPDKK